MRKIDTGRRALAAAASSIVLAGMLAACAGGPSAPAPVYQRGIAPMAGNPYSPAGAPATWRENTVITVKRGQSLGGIAHAYHVPERALIAANNLKPPYELRAGARLVIPDGNAPPPRLATNAAPPETIVTMPATAMPPSATPHPVPAPPPAAATAMAPQPLTPPSSASRGSPDVVPLDAPPKQLASGTQQPAPATVAPAAPGPATVSEPAPSGRFPWPVSGRILASYGQGTAGENEGINIAAPRGTAVRAIEGGTVAYAGTEVKGYGNLLLVKHPDGWISAYAHLDDLLVKKGDPVSAGEVIARVGNTGGVSEPQLHFELRRGRKPVDPRAFLAPAPSAGGQLGSKPG